VCKLGAQNVNGRLQNVTTAPLEKFKWDILDHPPYTPDLAPSDFHLFLHLKQRLAGKKFDEVDEVQEEVMTGSKACGRLL